MLNRLKTKGITIIVSTPYMDEAALCDRVALLQNGKILDLDTPLSIIAKFGRPLWSVRSKDMFQLLNDLRSADFTASCFAFGESHHLTVKNDAIGQLQIQQFLDDKHHQNIHIQQVTPSIEDCFMALM